MALNFPTGVLFSDPRANARIPNGKLSFFFSGTSGNTSVYQDAALTILWPQPIQADANGNFPPNIYFDPFVTVKAKIQITDASNVIKWTVDPYYIPFALTADSSNLQYRNPLFEIFIPAPPSAPALIINNLPGSVALRLVGGGLTVGGNVEPSWEVANLTTGAQTATFANVANKPGPANSTPVKWLPILSGGVIRYAPCFL